MTPDSYPERWTAAAVRALGVYTDLVTAGSVLGMGRTKAHELARMGCFPVPVIRHGRRYVVPVAPILHLLHLDSEQTNRSSDPI
jgi:hypothetical protein